MTPAYPPRPDLTHRRRPRRERTLALAAWLLTLTEAGAAETATATPGVSIATMLQTFAGLALILGLFVAAAWLVRRLNGSRTLLGSGGPLRVVGALALGPRERIVLVEVADTWLVIGLAPGQMRTLHTLPKGELPPVATTGAPPFAHWLRQFRDASRAGKD